MNTILITGGSSRIGGAVADRLKGDFRLLFLIHRRPVELGGVEAEPLPGGLDAAPVHATRIRSADLILHMAGLSYADREEEYLRVNLEGTRRLLDVSRRDQPFVYLSTRCAGRKAGGYGHSKLLAEEAIRASGRPFAVIRPAEVYGSKNGEGIDALLELARRFGVLIDFRARPPVTYSPIAVNELVDLVAAVVRKAAGSGGTYTACNDRSYSIHEIRRALAAGLGRRVHLVPLPVSALRLALRLRLPLPFKVDQLTRLVMEKPSDNSAAREDLGFAPRSFLEYLRAPSGAGAG